MCVVGQFKVLGRFLECGAWGPSHQHLARTEKQVALLALELWLWSPRTRVLDLTTNGSRSLTPWDLDPLQAY